MTAFMQLISNGVTNLLMNGFSVLHFFVSFVIFPYCEPSVFA
jgi:hypothetical protein